MWNCCFGYNRLTSLSPSISEFLQPGFHPTLEEDSVQLPPGVSVRRHPEQLPQLLWWLGDSSGWEGRQRKPAALRKHRHSDSSEWRCPSDTFSWGLGWFIHSCVRSSWEVIASRVLCPLGFWVGAWGNSCEGLSNNVLQQLQVQSQIVTACSLHPARGTAF